jgi:hypothetical protein
MNLRFTHALAQAVPIALIVISIACSTSKSASPQPQLTANQAAIQSSTRSTGASVQTTTGCTLGLSEAPVINGLKLGMTPNDVLAVFPGSKEDAELHAALSNPLGPLGNGSLAIIPSKYKSPADFKDVNRVTFGLLDGHVSSLTISYNGPEWPTVDKFVDKFLENKHLPSSDQWEPYVGMETQMKTLTCSGFSIRIFSGGEHGNQNYVLLQDLEANKKLKERRKKAREQASPTPGQ